MTQDVIFSESVSERHELKIVEKLIYNKCGLQITNLKSNTKDQGYGACSFELNNKVIEYRVSKITPKKTGQFVAIWKRNEAQITEPFDLTDTLDFFIITVQNDDKEKFGQFVFPKSVLVDQGILSKPGKIGKRGIRVYPPWDDPTNKQAQKTQAWQVRYFLPIETNNSGYLESAKRLFHEIKILND